MTISLQTETIPGKKRDPFLEQQMSKIEGAINAMSVTQTARLIAANYSVVSTDRWITVDASAGAVSISLLPAATGRLIGIKKIDTTANTVTVAAIGSDIIDGLATKVIAAQYEHYHFVPDGVGLWWIF